MKKTIIDSRGPLHIVLRGFVCLGRFNTLREAELVAGINV